MDSKEVAENCEMVQILDQVMTVEEKNCCSTIQNITTMQLESTKTETSETQDLKSVDEFATYFDQSDFEVPVIPDEPNEKLDDGNMFYNVVSDATGLLGEPQEPKSLTWSWIHAGITCVKNKLNVEEARLGNDVPIVIIYDDNDVGDDKKADEPAENQEKTSNDDDNKAEESA